MGIRSTRATKSLHVIGTFAAYKDHRRLVLRPSCQRVLGLLAVRGDLARSDAAGLLWPDSRAHRAQANLRTVLWRVRRDATQFVTEGGDILGLDNVEVDAAALRSWAWRAMRGEDPWMPPPPTIGRELLPGWSDDWLLQPREELRLLYLYALEAAAQRLLMTGRLGEAANLALTAVSIDPLRESANRLLIEVHLRDGNTADAIRQFAAYETRLLLETGAEPGAALTALVGAAKTHHRRDPTLSSELSSAKRRRGVSKN
jgi:DNA-binding SARP family transcriptional activator